MQLLKTQFQLNGFDYRQVERSATAAIYSQNADSSPSTHPAYEVVKVRVAPAENLFGKDMPEREVYPPSTAWGTAGWTYSGANALAEARQKFASLTHPKPETPVWRTLGDDGSSDPYLPTNPPQEFVVVPEGLTILLETNRKG